MNNTRTLLTSVALLSLTISPALAQSAPAKAPASDPVSASLSTFEKDFSDFVNLAETEAIDGPKKLELAERMKKDASVWFAAMQGRLMEKSKETASLNDRISKLTIELNTARTELNTARPCVTSPSQMQKGRTMQQQQQQQQLPSHK